MTTPQAGAMPTSTPDPIVVTTRLVVIWWRAAHLDPKVPRGLCAIAWQRLGAQRDRTRVVFVPAAAGQPEDPCTPPPVLGVRLGRELGALPVLYHASSPLDALDGLTRDLAVTVHEVDLRRWRIGGALLLQRGGRPGEVMVDLLAHDQLAAAEVDLLALWARETLSIAVDTGPAWPPAGWRLASEGRWQQVWRTTASAGPAGRQRLAGALPGSNEE